MLCGVALPWVDRIKHLGNTISNVLDGNQLDIRIKTAKYVDKCNSLSQEFFFAHPYTRVHLNIVSKMVTSLAPNSGVWAAERWRN